MPLVTIVKTCKNNVEYYIYIDAAFFANILCECPRSGATDWALGRSQDLLPTKGACAVWDLGEFI
jgi:hypothetical protein